MAITLNLEVIPEQRTAFLTGTLVDDTGTAIGSATLEAFQLSISVDTTIVNSRLHQDVYGTEASPVNGGWLNASGEFEVRLRPADTVIVGTVAANAQQTHELEAMFYWDSESHGSLTNPFSVSSGSKVVTVSHAGHGLTTGDDVCFNGASLVGGLNPNGVRIVTVADSNSYTFDVEGFQGNASSTVSGGGGAIEWFANGLSASDIVSFVVRSVDKIPS